MVPGPSWVQHSPGDRRPQSKAGLLHFTRQQCGLLSTMASCPCQSLCTGEFRTFFTSPVWHARRSSSCLPGMSLVGTLDSFVPAMMPFQCVGLAETEECGTFQLTLHVPDCLLLSISCVLTLHLHQCATSTMTLLLETDTC